LRHREAEKFRIFNACHKASIITEQKVPDMTMFNTMTVTDDEHNNNELSDDESVNEQAAQTSPMMKETDRGMMPKVHVSGYNDTWNHAMSYDAYTKHVNVIEDDLHEANGKKLDPTGELLLWHYRLAHLQFARLQNMAKAGELPSRFKECCIPKCSACLYGKMTQQPKRTNGRSKQIRSETIIRPGECVSVDQLAGIIHPWSHEGNPRYPTIQMCHYLCGPFQPTIVRAPTSNGPCHPTTQFRAR
jgi:hypothetical protein